MKPIALLIFCMVVAHAFWYVFGVVVYMVVVQQLDTWVHFNVGKWSQAAIIAWLLVSICMGLDVFTKLVTSDNGGYVPDKPTPVNPPAKR